MELWQAAWGKDRLTQGLSYRGSAWVLLLWWFGSILFTVFQLFTLETLKLIRVEVTLLPLSLRMTNPHL